MKSNIQLQGLIRELKKQSNAEKVALWKRLANDLEKPTRMRRVVNLTKLNKCSKENEIIVVPGKVLGTGELDHKVTVAAFNFSKQAIEKIENAKGTIYSIYEFMQKNPKGQKTRILG